MQNHLLFLPTEIKTPRLNLRRFQIGDGKSYFNLVQNNKEHLTDFPTTMSKNTSAEESEKYIQKCIAQWYLQEVYFYAICENDSEKIIGMMRIFKIDWKLPSAEIAYLLDDNYKGRGYVTEALQHTIKFCFDVLQMNKLYLGTNIGNKGSQRVAVKNGFALEGTHKQDFKNVNGELVDIFSFGLTRTAYVQQLT
ncbi:MAG: RimJ/RimL family protein N-acetyltransferase [Saprospiraceae bacterium]|jgi:RimJ/RimL family protein N-acetyltransferase